FTEIFHSGNALAGAEPRRCRAVQLRRAEQIVVADDLGRRGLTQRNQIVERNHPSGIGSDIVFADISRPRTESLGRLKVDAVSAVVEIEIVYIRRPHINAQRICDLLQGYMQALGLFAVNRYEKLRIVRSETAEHSCQ